MLPIKNVMKTGQLVSEIYSVMRNSFCALFYFSKEKGLIIHSYTYGLNSARNISP